MRFDKVFDIHMTLQDARIDPRKMLGAGRGSRRRLRAFSLIEFTVVLALIAVLAGVVTVSVRHHLIRGKQNAARGEMASIREAIESFYTITGRYPTNEEGLEVLTKGTERHPDPILPRVPKDPFGQAYVYLQPGRVEPYEVICLGAGGREGGTGAETDINSTDPNADAAK